ncbi:hypothetical protein BGX24_002946 [Mortierella sp. AD032]|nr:hypothetical protein BGX24_002946 [Mortierella sp. AD032]
MTMNPRKYVPRPPAEIRIRASSPTTTRNNSTLSSSSDLNKALPPPPAPQQQKANGTTKRTAAIFKGLKTRLQHRRPSTGSLSLTGPSSPIHAHANESVAQEYARTIKSLWKMVEDEEQAHRLVEASHSLSGCIPTIADINLDESAFWGYDNYAERTKETVVAVAHDHRRDTHPRGGRDFYDLGHDTNKEDDNSIVQFTIQDYDCISSSHSQ